MANAVSRLKKSKSPTLNPLNETVKWADNGYLEDAIRMLEPSEVNYYMGCFIDVGAINTKDSR
jgi:hypothetical protein